MKKNMKKIMALLLTVTLSLGLYGCGSKNDKTESGQVRQLGQIHLRQPQTVLRKKRW